MKQSRGFGMEIMMLSHKISFTLYNMQKIYKISPSDFAYLYEDCKHCYYLKIKHGITQPSMPMPGVFGAINTRVQNSLIGHDLSSLSPHLPQGKVIKQEGFVESAVVPGTHLYIKGKYDLLVEKPDGNHLLIDFKLSQPQNQKVEKYKTQLFAYKYALEHPKRDIPIVISQLGLIIMYPNKVTIQDHIVSVQFPPVYLEVPIDETDFFSYIQKVNILLSGPIPPENPDCKWCQYRKTNSLIREEITENTLPF